MLGRHTLVLDTFCELSESLRPFADVEFWDFDLMQPIEHSVMVVSRQTLNKHAGSIRSLAESKSQDTDNFDFDYFKDV